MASRAESDDVKERERLMFLETRLATLEKLLMGFVQVPTPGEQRPLANLWHQKQAWAASNHNVAESMEMLKERFDGLEQRKPWLAAYGQKYEENLGYLMAESRETVHQQHIRDKERDRDEHGVGSIEDGMFMLSAEAKAKILLETQDSIKLNAEYLEKIKELSQYINPPSLKEVGPGSEKLRPLRLIHVEECKAEEDLGQRVDTLFDRYNETIALLSEKFCLWDRQLKRIEDALGIK